MTCGFICVAVIGSGLTVLGQGKSDDELPNRRPGLVASYTDRGQPSNSYTAIESAVALALKVDESPHPRLDPRAGLQVRWVGRIKVIRPDKYRFGAFLRGQLRVSIDGKEVFAAEVSDKEAGWRQTPPIALPAGALPLVVEFTSRPGAARVQLFWEASYYRNEPVPYDVLSHSPEQEPAELARDQLADKGRLLAERHSCTACHQPRADDEFAKSLKNRLGPDLSQAGKRLDPKWIGQWLEAPRQVHARALMPRLLTDPKRPDTQADLHALIAFVSTRGGTWKFEPEKLKTDELQASIRRGEKLFKTVGCAVCHELDPLSVGRTIGEHPIPDQTGKRSVAELSQYLQNPLAIDPHGAMPSLILNGEEARNVARFLWHDNVHPSNTYSRADGETAAASDPQTLQLGERLAVTKRCINCHTFSAGGKAAEPNWAKTDFEGIKREDAKGKGCLELNRSGGEAPIFAFSSEDLKALRAFLASAPSRTASSPAYLARMTLQRLNCLGCHSREGQGGLTTEMTDTLRKFENAENAEAVSPPPLTGVGNKLQSAWIRQVLTQAGRARPWMALRMPQFGETNVGHLPEALAALDGVDTTAKDEVPPFNSVYVDAGKHMVGKKGFGCIACHDIAGAAASGTRGPDLALMQQRVRYSWYRRWLEQPQRMQPGTRMPTIFAEGRTLLDDVLHGRADAQADAIWVYLSLGMSLPLPEGLEPPKGVVLSVKDRPVILRTFMPDVGSHAIAVGYPDNVSIAFDAGTCRLAYAWSGNFLDASPTWNDRGGSPAKPLGQRIWESPRGFPWAFTTNGSTPHFAAQARDPALGGALPEGQLYAGPRRLFFMSYEIDANGQPAFKYRREVADGVSVIIGEQVHPLRRPTAVGLARQFVLSQPGSYTPWFLAGESASEPRVFNADGAEVALDLKSGAVELAAAGLAVLLSQGDRWTVAQVQAAPGEAQWSLHRIGSSWQLLLRLPSHPQSQDLRLTLSVWQPYRNEIGVVRELVSSTKGSP